LWLWLARSCVAYLWAEILLESDPGHVWRLTLGALQELRDKDHCWAQRPGIVTLVSITPKGHLPISSCRKGCCFWGERRLECEEAGGQEWFAAAASGANGASINRMWKPNSDHYREIGAPGSWRTSLGGFFQGSDLSKSHLDVIGRSIDFRVTKASLTHQRHT
jgi:hypothetical protein